MSESFGSTGMHERVFSAVYVKGKEKIIYWSTLDGKARGAVYKKLPTGARISENPTVPFRERPVVGGLFPESEAGKALLREFVDYTAAPGPGELMHSAVFRGTDNSKEKRAREYVNITLQEATHSAAVEAGAEE